MNADLLRRAMPLVTKGIGDRIRENEEFNTFVTRCLHRHLSGDWGDVCDDTRRMNDSAVESFDGAFMEDRVMSVYTDDTFGEVWIITEYDLSATTILLPEEY